MVQALLIKGMRQRADNVILSDKRSEVFGAPFSSENLVGHRRILSGSDHGIDVPDANDGQKGASGTTMPDADL